MLIEIRSVYMTNMALGKSFPFSGLISPILQTRPLQTRDSQSANLREADLNLCLFILSSYLHLEARFFFC